MYYKLTNGKIQESTEGGLDWCKTKLEAVQAAYVALQQLSQPIYEQITRLSDQLVELNHSIDAPKIELFRLSMMLNILSEKTRYPVDNALEQYTLCTTQGTEVSSSSGQFTDGYTEHKWLLDGQLYTFEMLYEIIQGCYSEDA